MNSYVESVVISRFIEKRTGRDPVRSGILRLFACNVLIFRSERGIRVYIARYLRYIKHIILYILLRIAMPAMVSTGPPHRINGLSRFRTGGAV